MVKRYYCDYCDRRLPCSVEARKKHNAGHQHLTAKKLYFDKFKSAKELLEEEAKKSKCRKFHSGQTCSFGAACFYSHLTAPDFDALKKRAYLEEELEIRKQTPSQILRDREPSIEGFMREREVILNEEKTFCQDLVEIIKAYNNYTPYLERYTSLPPSLQPPTIQDICEVQFHTWGNNFC